MTLKRYTLCPGVLNSIINRGQVIQLAVLSYRGHELKHAALHGAGRYVKAFDAFDAMLCMLERASDTIDVRGGSSAQSYSESRMFIDVSGPDRHRGSEYPPSQRPWIIAAKAEEQKSQI